MGRCVGCFARGSATVGSMSTFHDLTMTSITGEAVSFDRFADTVCLAVNVASR
jgi:hypothetical protein